ncbi:TPA: glycosyltransferase family 2 protein [Clostridium perfringens]|nr:glycosyltransferase family 2 protein [Clostridium perfringens]
MNKKVSIVLINYNTARDTIECIESLDKVTYDKFDLIIVDNKSKEDDLKKLEIYTKNKKNCTLVKAEKNGGFAYGNNIGIDIAMKRKSDYILLLNSDTEVEEDFLEYLVKTLEEDIERNAIAIGKINYYSNKKKIWYGGGEIDWNKYIGIHYGENQDDFGQFDKKKEITFATGCAMLINANLPINTKLPEEYFMYFEDVDFCASILEKGYKIIYEPKAVIYHKVGASGGGESSPFTLRWSNRGRFIFMNKYKYKSSKLKFFLTKNYFYATRIIKSICLSIKGDFISAKAIISGTLDGMKSIR